MRLRSALIFSLLPLAAALPSTALSRSHRSVRAASSMSTAPRTVLVPIATGTEEMEAVAVIDVLVRAGAAVTVASASGSLQVTCSRGVKLVADVLLDELADTAYDAIVIPGGMPGAEHLANSDALARMLRAHHAAGKLTAAICAAPVVVLQKHGLLEGRAATAHPAFSDKLPDQAAVPTRVVVDGHVITSRGPGTAIEFALALVEALYGAEKAKAVAGPMVVA